MIFVKLDSLSPTACRGGAKTGSYALLEGSRSRSNLKGLIHSAQNKNHFQKKGQNFTKNIVLSL